jgi:hypothetical protein
VGKQILIGSTCRMISIHQFNLTSDELKRNVDR